jgi:NitT/TauT family transport system permease protein
MSEVDPRGYSAGELGELVDEGREPGGRATFARLARVVVPPVIALVFLGALWQLVASRNPHALPSLGAVYDELTGNLSFYASNAGWTLEEVAIGLGASFVVAFALATVMTHVAVVERAVMPIAVILNVTPIVAIAPGLALLLGLGQAPRYVVTALIVFFPLLVNSLIGLRNVDPEALDFFRTLRASKLEILVHLRIPSSLPFLFAAARICFPLAVVGAVVAEFSTSGAAHGLGYVIDAAISVPDLPAIYAAIFCLAVMGLVLTALVGFAERRVIGSHAERVAHLARRTA